MRGVDNLEGPPHDTKYTTYSWQTRVKAVRGGFCGRVLNVMIRVEERWIGYLVLPAGIERELFHRIHGQTPTLLKSFDGASLLASTFFKKEQAGGQSGYRGNHFRKQRPKICWGFSSYEYACSITGDNKPQISFQNQLYAVNVACIALCNDKSHGLNFTNSHAPLTFNA